MLASLPNEFGTEISIEDMPQPEEQDDFADLLELVRNTSLPLTGQLSQFSTDLVLGFNYD